MFENHYPRLRCHASRDRVPLTSSFHAPACLGLCPTFATTSHESLAGHFLPASAALSVKWERSRTHLLCSASSEPCFQGGEQHPALWLPESSSDRSCHRWEPVPDWPPSPSSTRQWDLSGVGKALSQTHETSSPGSATSCPHDLEQVHSRCWDTALPEGKTPAFTGRGHRRSLTNVSVK